jgi:LysM repeat protein
LGRGSSKVCDFSLLLQFGGDKVTVTSKVTVTLYGLLSYYNEFVEPKTFLQRCLLVFLLAGFLYSPVSALVAQPAARSIPASGATAYDLIVAMNSLRVSNGFAPLVEDPIIDAVAQSTAQIMADNQMSWHIGDVPGRISAAGYGGGAKVWATENFSVGMDQSIDEIMVIWSDAAHMLPATNGAYCNVGAGTAKSANGRTYYILQAAYVAGKACGEYTSSGGATTSQTGSTTTGGVVGVPQIIMPVKVATPDAEGKVFHEVQAGQSFWAIAIAYKITIKDLKSWNNIPESVTTLKTGQKLFIPGSNTAGYATPTQPGAIQVSTPDAEGRIFHTVQSYQTLSTIAQAYGTTVDTILRLNGLQVDWPLRIGQQLLVHPSNFTPTATLSPIQRLTPADDGKYYHSIRSGETLSWIANLYGVKMNDLMAWNGLTGSSIIRPDQKLLLLVTPPASETPTPLPPTTTPTVDMSTPTLAPTLLPVTPSPNAAEGRELGLAPLLGGGAVLLIVVGLGLFFRRRMK